MPGIDDVDRQFRRTVRLDGVTMEEATTAAKRIEEAADRVIARHGLSHLTSDGAPPDPEAFVREAGCRVATEGDWLDRAVDAAYGPAAADDERIDLSSADRRDARLSALTLAAHVLPETPAAALADETPIEAVTLRIARAFERYLLGDDPPKPPAKME